jgi:hypothetical protein
MPRKTNRAKKPSAMSAVSRSEATERKAADRRFEALHQQIREILAAARERAWQAVNSLPHCRAEQRPGMKSDEPA